MNIKNLKSLQIAAVALDAKVNANDYHNPRKYYPKNIYLKDYQDALREIKDLIHALEGTKDASGEEIRKDPLPSYSSGIYRPLIREFHE